MTDRDPFEVVRAALGTRTCCGLDSIQICRSCEEDDPDHATDCLVPAAREALAEIHGMLDMQCTASYAARHARAQAFREAAEIAEISGSIEASAIARAIRARAEEAS